MTGLYVLARFGVIDTKHRRTAPAVCHAKDKKTRVLIGSTEVFLTYKQFFRKDLTSMKQTTTSKQASGF